jgi:hypothetical protein
MLFGCGNVSAFSDVLSKSLLLMGSFIVAAGYNQRLIPCVVVRTVYGHFYLGTEINHRRYVFLVYTVRTMV